METTKVIETAKKVFNVLTIVGAIGCMLAGLKIDAIMLYCIHISNKVS